MQLVGLAPSASWEELPIDAAEFELWRCTTYAIMPNGERDECGAEIKRKPDGTRTRDPRWE